ncbi:MAG: UDP-N-acetylglucosamine 2-epimerase [Pseudomonadota bacterium]
MSKKICVVVNSRANYGRIKSFMRAVQEHPELELQLIVGASALLFRFGNVIDNIRLDGFEPTAIVYSIVEGENLTTMAKSTGLGIIELASLFEQMQPDFVLTVADRFETLATAVAASYMNIPVVHTQGGEVSGSIDESVRHAITKLSHIHFPATEKARDILLRMGEDPNSVYVTGCPAMDILAESDLTLSPDLFEKNLGVGEVIDPGVPYVVVLQHPVTTEFGEGADQINHTLVAVNQLKMQAVWLWPNVDAGSDSISKQLRTFHEHNPSAPISFHRNFSVEDYARLINNAACVIGNSSSGIRECAFLGIPAVNIGSRQALRETGPNVLHAPYDSDEIYQTVQKQLQSERFKRSNLFGNGTAGKQMADVLAATSDVSLQKRLWYSDV